MTAGRPSDYDPAFCDQVVEHGRDGKSRAWIAAKLGVVRQTLANWEAAHPEFLDAMTHAGDLAQMWWEDAGQSGMLTQGFNGSVYSRSMAARFPADWREVKASELSGPGGAPIPIAEVRRTIVDPQHPNS